MLKISNNEDNKNIKSENITKNKKTQASQKAKKKKKWFHKFRKKEVYADKVDNETLENIGSSVNIINRDVLNILNPLTIEDVLGTAPGIIINRRGSVGNVTSFSIRGWDRNLITLDGVRFNSPELIQPILNPLLVNSLHRIEIVKGPQPSFNGTQAQGGMIALYTRKGKGKPSVEFDTGYGNATTFRENFTFQGEKKNADYYLGVIRLDTTGGAPTFLDQPENDDYGNTSIVSNFGGRLLNGKAEVRNIFTYSTAEKQQGVQINGFPVFDPDDHCFNSIIYENLSFKHSPKNWYDYNLRLSFIKSTFKDYDNDNIINFQFYKTKNNRLSLLNQHNLYFKNFDTFSVGYELEFNDFQCFDINKATLDQDITKNDVFFHNTINLKDTLFIRTGARITHHSEVGTYGMPNASIVLKLPTFNIKDSYSKFRTSYGYSLNEPTPYQLYGLYGNPYLKPERYHGFDIGFVQSFFKENMQLECSYFNNKVDNLIARDPYLKTLTLKNIQKAKTSGVETSLYFLLHNTIKARVSYTYLNARQRNVESGQYGPIEAVPNNTWSFIIGYIPSTNYGLYFRGTTSSTRFGID